MPVAYGVILVALAYRYLPVFPQEAELNPGLAVEADMEMAAAEKVTEETEEEEKSSETE
jgi:molybdopterin-containing oxidoreductase family membrane subunit